MGHAFLSDDWFAAVAAVGPVADDGSRILNLVVTDGPDGERHAHVVGDTVRPGHSPDAGATLTAPYAVAYPALVNGPMRGLFQSIVAESSWLDGDFDVLAEMMRWDGTTRKGLSQRLKPLTDLPPARHRTIGTGVDNSSDDAARGEIERLGLSEYARQFDKDGYAIVPPEVTGMTSETIDRLLARSLEVVAERTGVVPDVETGETHRNVHVPSIYYFLFEDRVFEENLMQEHMLALAEYAVGTDCVVSGMSLFAKGPADAPATGNLQLALHSDASGSHPEPLPDEVQTLNCTWCLTDYRAELGATAFVPGSHRERRMPVGLEGQDRLVTADAPKGSLMLWGGNTWHGSHQRTVPGLRVGLAWNFHRPFLSHPRYFEEVSDEVLVRNSPRFARLMGLAHISGFGTEGPNRRALERARDATRRRAMRAELVGV